MLSEKFLRDRYAKKAEEIGVGGGQGRSPRENLDTAHGCMVACILGLAAWGLIWLFILILS